MSFRDWENEPGLIAGPCSAESKEQLFETAEGLKGTKVNLFRTGVWKARTKPGSFEGVGEDALKWLQELKQAYSLPVCVEIAEPAHLELALKYDIDAIWIGARTTVNPFQIQVLADAIRGVSLPVMVKNPVNPDVDLWEGAIERFERAGITDIAAIHRGFSTYKASGPFRNQPNWVIPIELKRRRPDLYMICDPSHITGTRKLVPDVAQKALNLGFNGLMIETHPNPEKAKSDAAQQLTPEDLKAMLSHLKVRKQFTSDMSKSAELEYLRQMMDSVDAEIVDLLSRRMAISERMGAVKKESDLSVYDHDRWREIVDSLNNHALEQNLSADFVVSLYEKIHHESIRLQLEILEKKTAEGKLK